MSTNTERMERKLVCLGPFTEFRIGSKRTSFKCPEEAFVPVDPVALDNTRIYAIYDLGSRYFVVYETEKVDFYRPYLAPLPPSNAKLIDKLTMRTASRCARCGSIVELEQDADDIEWVCPTCGMIDPDDVIEGEVVVVYTAKPFDRSAVVQGDGIKTFSQVCEEILQQRYGVTPRLRRGHVGTAGRHHVEFISPKITKLNVNGVEVEVREGIGYEYESFYDEVPSVHSPAYYVEIRALGKIEFAEIRELNDDEKILLAAEKADYAVYKWKFDKKLVAEALRKHGTWRKYDFVFLAELGLVEEAKQLFRELVEKRAQKIEELIRERKVTDVDFEDLVQFRHLDEQAFKRVEELWNKYQKLKEQFVREKEEEERRRREEEAKRKEQEAKRAVDLIRSKLPSWADGAVVYYVVYRGEDYDIDYFVKPVKKSKYNDDYYFSREWKNVDVERGVAEKIISQMKVERRDEAVLILKDKVVKAKLINGKSKYITVRHI